MALIGEDRQLFLDATSAIDEIPAGAAEAMLADDRLVHRMFENQAAKSPQAIAVTMGDQSWTYGQLNARATALARGIAPHLRSTESLVGIYIERTPDMIAGILAILKAGAAYLPLDPGLPEARLAQIVGDADPDLLLCDHPISGVSWAKGINTLSLVAACKGGERLFPLTRPLRSDALAYVMYTSGTTGRPKGVEVRHEAVANLIGSMRVKPGLRADDILLSATRMTFDVSVLDFFLPLTSGAHLHLVSSEVSHDPARLAAVIDRSCATVMQATPATWRALMEAGWNGSAHLRIWSGGERLERSLAERLMPRCAELWNLYGPTETTVWSTVERVRSGSGPVPIGCAIEATTLHILNESGEPAPDGQMGELCIGGAGLARGYHNRTDLTAERFITLTSGERVYRTGDLAKRDPDGALLCLGRTDDQVKIRGFRVEMGEIEGLIQQHPEIAWCAVRCWIDPTGNNGLFAYVVGRAAGGPEEFALLAYLRNQLPDYMVPLRIFSVSALPLTSNGKIDRNALPPPADFDRSRASESPELLTPAERRLAHIWGELLGPRDFKGSDDFFDLGGYSLLTVRLMRRIAEEFGTSVSLASLFAASDLQTMAELAERDQPWDNNNVLPLHPHGTRLPLIWLDGGPLIRRVACLIDPDQPVIGLNASAEDEVNLAKSPLTVSALAKCMLGRLREVQPEGPYRIGGWCRWGVVAYELARLLIGEGEEVLTLILLDAENPASLSWRDRGRLIREDWKKALRRSSLTLEKPSFSESVSYAANRYSPSNYGGDVLLIQPMEGHAGRADGGWLDCVRGNLDVHLTPGDHESMVRPPNSAALAATIRDGLARLNTA